MAMEKVGEINEKEKYEILIIHERRNALMELALTVKNKDLNENEVKMLSEKIKAVYKETEEQFKSWWDFMSEKYNWKKDENGAWSLDFNTNEIYLVSE